MKGNGLTVVFVNENITKTYMQQITQEFNQFETIFIYPEKDDQFIARVFTLEEELDFAGHPILGAAGVIFAKQEGVSEKKIILKLNDRIIETIVKNQQSHVRVMMNQGKPKYLRCLNIQEASPIINSMNLTIDDIENDYPIEVVSTGLSYLLLPVKNYESLKKTKIKVADLENKLLQYGAKFIYVFDPHTLECRTWDNGGLVEDIATGSAAGPLCAYLIKNGYRKKGEEVLIRQGSFLGRASIIKSWMEINNDEIKIEGAVSFFSKGNLLISHPEVK
ncbi:MAG: PhzF family phenazine biosynthesis protein [Spirochaetes bacterium]|nr:PhzF family phenazine biosynthesis protein [Spirochaetota bacterium]